MVRTVAMVGAPLAVLLTAALKAPATVLSPDAAACQSTLAKGLAGFQ